MQRVGGGLSDGERGDGRLRGGLAGCGFGGNKHGQVDVFGVGGLGGKFLNDNGGAEDGLESAFFQLRRQRAGAVERSGEPNGGGGGGGALLPGPRLGEDVFGGGFSALFGVGLRRFGFGVEDGAIGREKRANVDFVVFHNCVGAERGVAVAADFCAKSAFGQGADADGGVVDWGGQGGVFGGGALHCEDSLSDGRNKKVCGEDLGDFLLHTHSAESGGCQNEGVALSGLHFCEAGLQISPDGCDFQARKMAGYQRGAAGAGSADNGAVREVPQGEVLAGDDGVAGVFGKSDGGQEERRGGGGGHVFEGVDGEMCAVCEEFGLERLDKEFFSADVGEGSVGDLVAAGGDAEDVCLNRGAEAGEGVGNRLRLRQGKGAFAGDDTKAHEMSCGGEKGIIPFFGENYVFFAALGRSGESV